MKLGSRKILDTISSRNIPPSHWLVLFFLLGLSINTSWAQRDTCARVDTCVFSCDVLPPPNSRYEAENIQYSVPGLGTIILSNVLHDSFDGNFPPPGHGNTTVHGFHSHLHGGITLSDGSSSSFDAYDVLL